MTDNYIKILEELEPFGANNATDLSPLFKRLYKKPDGTSGEKETITPYLHLLDDMVSNNHIKYDKEQNRSIGLDVSRHQHWFERPVKIAITTQGLDYLNNRLLAKSVLSANSSAILTNRATVRNSNIQLIFSLATIAVAAVTAYLTYKYSEANDDVKLRLEAIERKIDQKTQNQDSKTIQTDSIESTKTK